MHVLSANWYSFFSVLILTNCQELKFITSPCMQALKLQLEFEAYKAKPVSERVQCLILPGSRFDLFLIMATVYVQL